MGALSAGGLEGGPVAPRELARPREPGHSKMPALPRAHPRLGRRPTRDAGAACAWLTAALVPTMLSRPGPPHTLLRVSNSRSAKAHLQAPPFPARRRLPSASGPRQRCALSALPALPARFERPVVSIVTHARTRSVDRLGRIFHRDVCLGAWGGPHGLDVVLSRSHCTSRSRGGSRRGVAAGCGTPGWVARLACTEHRAECCVVIVASFDRPS